MILDLLIEEEQKISRQFTGLFSKINLINIDHKRNTAAQVSEIEKKIDQPSVQRMLVYSKKYNMLGTVLSRRYFNSAIIKKGPLKVGNMCLSPDHLSCLPSQKKRNRILFLAPHFDEAYLAAIILHNLIGDEVFLYSFTFPKEKENQIKQSYQILGLNKDDYNLGLLKENQLFKESKAMTEIIRELLSNFKPTVVFSIFPKGANFDHIAVSKVTKNVVLKESTADLIYGYVIQSRNIQPIIFPIYNKPVYNKILQGFSKEGFGGMFKKYLPFLKYYTQTFSEPLFRMIGEKNIKNIYTLPLEADRISNYNIPNIINYNEFCARV